MDGRASDVEDASRKAMQMLSALSDAAVSGGRLTSEMSSCANASNAKCQPWSRQDYLSRLASFSPMTWFNKPIASNRPSPPLLLVYTFASLCGASVCVTDFFVQFWLYNHLHVRDR